MKFIFFLVFSFMVSPIFANTWEYEVRINNNVIGNKHLSGGKNSFEAGPYLCEVTPVLLKDNTEFRTLICSAGAGTISTGGLCTTKGHKFPSVQYAILNLNVPKNLVNIVVSCKFDL